MGEYINMKKVNKKTRIYFLCVELIQLLIISMVFVGINIFFVPKYVSFNKLFILAVMVVAVDIMSSVNSIIKVKNNYYCYGANSDFLEIYTWEFYKKRVFLPVRHIKYITISQNLLQRKLKLVDVLISTGVSKHKIQCLSEAEGEEIKKELDEIIRVVAYDGKA